jgi:hypothetical protein
MASIGRTPAWGAEQWASYVLEHLSAESVLLRSGARRIDVQGTEAHVPRLLDDGTVAWVAEGADIPSDAPEADTLLLVPKKLANVVSLEQRIHRRRVGVGAQRDGRRDDPRRRQGNRQEGVQRRRGHRNVAGRPTRRHASRRRPARSISTAILTAIGAIEAAGGVANAVYANPAT